MRRLLPLLLAVTAGCNKYDYFIADGSRQQSFTNDASVLFVVDNSPSMVDEAASLATNFEAFIEQFAADEPPADPKLVDDVERFLAEVANRSGTVDYRLGITSTELWKARGRLLGAPNQRVLDRGDANVPRKFQQNLLCNAACVDPNTNPVAIQCPGGGTPDTSNCAAPDDASGDPREKSGANEEGIEAVFMAMCQAVPDPPEACFQDWWITDNARWVDSPPPETPNAQPEPYFSEEDIGTNAEWLGLDGDDQAAKPVIVPVIITDEGDGSRRLDDRDPNIGNYLDLFRQFDYRFSFAVISKPYEVVATSALDDDGLAVREEIEVRCKELAIAWGIQRYKSIVEATNGLYIDLQNPLGDTCENNDFGEILTDVGQLLRGLADTFPLDTTPLVDTIIVEVNGSIQPRTVGVLDEELGITIFGDGWSYDEVRNAVLLHGEAVPEFNADVNVWYLPDPDAPELPVE